MIFRFITSIAASILTLLLAYVPVDAAAPKILQAVDSPNTVDGFFMFQSIGADYGVKSPFRVKEAEWVVEDKTGSFTMNMFVTVQELEFKNYAFGGVVIFKNERTKEIDLSKQLTDIPKSLQIPIPDPTYHNIRNGKAAYFESKNNKVGLITIVFENDTKFYKVFCLYPIEDKQEHSRCDIAIDSFQINGMTRINWASLK